MKERPILFSGPMVRAILDGRKTQTRRAVKPQPLPDTDEVRYLDDGWAYEAILEEQTEHYRSFAPNPSRRESFKCPYGMPGDRLWVREAHALVPTTAYRGSEGVQQTINPQDPDQAGVYREGWDRCKPGRWRPSIHMPRWASRIMLEITDVRVERLQDISRDNAMAEGIERKQSIRWEGKDVFRDYMADDPLDPEEGEWFERPQSSFRSLWQSINGPESWDENPWVWVVKFKRIEA